MKDGTEAQEIIESEFDENKLYDIYNMILEDQKGKLGWHKSAIERKSKIHMRLKFRMVWLVYMITK